MTREASTDGALGFACAAQRSVHELRASRKAQNREFDQGARPHQSAHIFFQGLRLGIVFCLAEGVADQFRDEELLRRFFVEILRLLLVALRKLRLSCSLPTGLAPENGAGGEVSSALGLSSSAAPCYVLPALGSKTSAGGQCCSHVWIAGTGPLCPGLPPSQAVSGLACGRVLLSNPQFVASTGPPPVATFGCFDPRSVKNCLLPLTQTRFVQLVVGGGKAWHEEAAGNSRGWTGQVVGLAPKSPPAHGGLMVLAVCACMLKLAIGNAARLCLSSMSCQNSQRRKSVCWTDCVMAAAKHRAAIARPSCVLAHAAPHCGAAADRMSAHPGGSCCARLTQERPC